MLSSVAGETGPDLHPASAPFYDDFMEILKILFTPEEATVACRLTFKLQSLPDISRKTGRETEVLRRHLENMADRGVVLSRPDKQGGQRYCLMPTIPGLFEYPFMSGQDLPRQELSRLWQRYHLESFGNQFAGSATPQMRVIPLQKSIPLVTEVLPYENVAEMIARASFIAVSSCTCRVSMQRCDKPLEMCLAFEARGQFLVERGMARAIDRQEALSILNAAEKAGLVHCTNNTRDRFAVVCNCCSCCCMVLRGMTQLNNPHAVARSSYVVSYTADDCSGCCEGRCPVGAIQAPPGPILLSLPLMLRIYS